MPRLLKKAITAGKKALNANVEKEKDKPKAKAKAKAKAKSKVKKTKERKTKGKRTRAEVEANDEEGEEEEEKEEDEEEDEKDETPPARKKGKKNSKNSTPNPAPKAASKAKKTKSSKKWVIHALGCISESIDAGKHVEAHAIRIYCDGSCLLINFDQFECQILWVGEANLAVKNLHTMTIGIAPLPFWQFLSVASGKGKNGLSDH